MSPLELVRNEEFEDADLFMGPSPFEVEIAGLLASTTDEARLSAALTELCKLASDRMGRLAFVEWIDGYAREWAAHRRLSLAIVIEAAIRLDSVTQPLVEAMVLALQDDGAVPLVQSVAAQRIRAVAVQEPLRAPAAAGLLRQLQRWSQYGDDRFVLAVSSLGYLSPETAGVHLRSWIEDSNPVIAWAAAQATIDAGQRLPEATRTRITEVALRRLTQPFDPLAKFDLRAALLWLLGAVTTATQLAQVSAAIAHGFRTARHLEDAAAVRAGRLLVGRFAGGAVAAFQESFGTDLAEFHRFVAAVASNHGMHSRS